MVYGCLGLMSPPSELPPATDYCTAPLTCLWLSCPVCKERGKYNLPPKVVTMQWLKMSYSVCTLGTQDRKAALASPFPVHRIASELSRPCFLGLWLLSRPKEMEQSIQNSLGFVSTTRNNSLLPVLGGEMLTDFTFTQSRIHTLALSPSLVPPCWIFLQSFCYQSIGDFATWALRRKWIAAWRTALVFPTGAFWMSTLFAIISLERSHIMITIYSRPCKMVFVCFRQ